MKRIAALIASLALCATLAIGDTRPLLVRLDCWVTCPPCKQVEAYLSKNGVKMDISPTDKQHVAEYPTAHFVSAGGAPYQISGSTQIIRALKAGVRYTGTGAVPTVEVRMWSGK
jgi:hypothetical protein